MSGRNIGAAEALALLEWQIAMGADEAIGEIARDWLAPAPAAEPVQPLPILPLPSFPTGPHRPPP